MDELDLIVIRKSQEFLKSIEAYHLINGIFMDQAFHLKFSSSNLLFQCHNILGFLSVHYSLLFNYFLDFEIYLIAFLLLSLYYLLVIMLKAFLKILKYI